MNNGLPLQISAIAAPLLILLFATSATAQSQVQLHQLFEAGQYCQILRSVDNHGAKLLPEDQLLYLESCLEMENWPLSDSVIQHLVSRPELATNSLLQNRFLLLRARYLQKTEKLVAAEALFKDLSRSWSLMEEADGQGQAEFLLYHGYFRYFISDYNEAARLYRRALALSEQDSRIKATILHRLGNLYKWKSERELAAAAFEESKVIWERLALLQHPGYADLLNDYCLFKLASDELDQAQYLLDLSTAINRRNCQITSKVAYNIGARGSIARKLKKFEAAQSEFEQVLRFMKRIDQHVDLATTYATLGVIQLEADIDKNLENAQAYYDSASANLQLAFGSERPSLPKAFILDGMARIADYEENYPLADSLYRLERQLVRSLVGPNTISYSTVLNNTAAFQEYYYEYQNTLDLYLESLETVRKIYGPKHSSYLTTLYNVARLYWELDSLSVADRHYAEANQLQLELLNKYFAAFDEKTRLDYRLQAMGNFDSFFNYAAATNDEDRNIAMQNLSLATKNAVLAYTSQFRQKLLNQTSADSIRRAWENANDYLSRAYSMTLYELEQQNWSIDSLETVREQLELAFIRSGKGQLHREQTATFESLISRLSKREAAVDFLTFPYHDGYRFDPDNLKYYALVSRKGFDSPKVIYLTDSKSLDSLFKNAGPYSEFLEVGHTLFKLVWAPLEPWLKDVKTVHISPDGQLFKIAFESLYSDPLDREQVLFNQYRFEYHNNLSDLMVREQISKNTDRSALLIGNPVFDVDRKSFMRWQEQSASEASESATGPPETSGPHAPLPGTATEIRQTEQSLVKRGYRVKSWAGPAALENKIKSLEGPTSPTILHIASHGYSYDFNTAPDTGAIDLESRFSRSRNAMLRSGLILTGGNYSWSGKSLPAKYEDGILTAQEVAGLNLNNTDLVVLSACETGHGKITDGEGVFGLPRAFRIAGARKLIISLWQVPDKSTTVFMNYFYKHYLKHRNAEKALRKAKSKMQKDYAPHFWAGFVLYN